MFKVANDCLNSELLKYGLFVRKTEVGNKHITKNLDIL